MNKLPESTNKFRYISFFFMSLFVKTLSEIYFIITNIIIFYTLPSIKLTV